MNHDGHRGAYGFRIVARRFERELPGLIESEAAADVVNVDWDVGEIASDAVEVDAHRATVAIAGLVAIEVERWSRSVSIRLPEPPRPEALVHPLLTTPLAILTRWEGRAALHAGAVLHNGGAIAVCGPQGAGKSSTLAALSRRGHPIASDDLVVVDDGEVLAGPACIDLRGDVAQRYPEADHLGVIGARERFRLPTPPAPPRTPLRAVVLLEWGDVATPIAEPLELIERVTLIHTFDYAALVGLPRPEALLDLVELPMWRLTRRRDAGADTAFDLIMNELR